MGTRRSHRQDPTWVGSTPDFSGSGTKGRWEHDSRRRKTGRFELWRYSQEVRKAESELKVQGQDLLTSQGHRASPETCEDREGERYTEARPRDPAGPPVASVILTHRAESPERSSQGSNRGLVGEPGLDLPSQDALGSMSITGSRPTSGQRAWALHATGHLHQGSDSVARVVRTSPPVRSHLRWTPLDPGPPSMAGPCTGTQESGIQSGSAVYRGGRWAAFWATELLPEGIVILRKLVHCFKAAAVF